MNFESRIHVKDSPERQAQELKTYKIDVLSVLAASDGTLAKMIPIFFDCCGTDPDHTARSLGYPDLEKFLESEVMAESVTRLFTEDGKKVFQKKRDPKVDRILPLTEKTMEVVKQRAATTNTGKVQEVTHEKLKSEEQTKRFRYNLCKVVRDLGGANRLVTLQEVQEAYFRRYNECLNKDCWRERFATHSAQRVLHIYFLNELSCTIVEGSGTIQMLLKRPFEEIKESIIKEIKTQHPGSDTTDMENDPVEPQPLEQINIHVLDESERAAVEYFTPHFFSNAQNDETRGSGSEK